MSILKALVGERRAKAINVMNASNHQLFEGLVPYGQTVALSISYKINDAAVSELFL